MLRRTDQPSLRKALSMRVSHRFTAGSARFDEDNLVSHAGLVAPLGLAEQTRLREIIAEKVSIKTPRIKSGAANSDLISYDPWGAASATSHGPKLASAAGRRQFPVPLIVVRSTAYSPHSPFEGRVGQLLRGG